MKLGGSVLFLALILAVPAVRSAGVDNCDFSGAAQADGGVTPGPVEAAFGPDGDAEALILRFISKARCSIRVAAYAFSSPRIVDALATAARRGLDVRLVVDFKHNVAEDNKGIGHRALATMVEAHAVARTNDRYRLLHDKFIVIDNRHVQTGSYNYAQSANSNSENVIVIWDDPALAARYLKHWRSRFEEGANFGQTGRIDP
jgi:phosphatidylserine/phosphatidylglycerophosphate/cardiolipin synthase-like enzyme